MNASFRFAYEGSLPLLVLAVAAAITLAWVLWPRRDEVRVLAAEKTPEGGMVRLEGWPEGYVLWHHGRIVWKEWE